MLLHQNFYFRVVLLTIFTLSLISCGGGDSGGTPAKETTPPTVVSTSPTSEQINVAPNTAITVTFSENISGVIKSNISIYPVESGVTNKDKPVDFQFSTSSNALTIEPILGQIITTSVYEVTISGIKDTSDNVLASPCTWIFATEGAESISTGAIGVCGTIQPVIAGPSEAPQNVKAELIDETTVKVSWEVPLSGNTPNYYQVEKTIDNKQNYTVVIAKETKLTYTDRNALIGIPHIYKITAGSDIAGLSKVPAISNEVTPSTVISNSAFELISPSPAAGNEFGGSFAFSSDGNFIFAGEEYADINTVVSAGKVHIFKKSATGWSHVQTLSSEKLVASGRFGNFVDISSDGTSLAIAEFGSGLVHLYKIDVSGWVFNHTINLASFSFLRTYVAFSPSSTELAISSGNKIELYRKSNTNIWEKYDELIPSTNTLATRLGGFITFSLDGLNLAITADNQLMSKSFVHLYTNTNGIFGFSQELDSGFSNTTINFGGSNYGYQFAFSPDNKSFVVGDVSGGLNSLGNESFFTKATTGWTPSSTLDPFVVAPNNRFGFSVSFSPDGKLLAVGSEHQSGAKIDRVELFSKVNSNWSHLKTFSYQVTNLTGFISGIAKGSIVVFSPDSSVLAIGVMGANTDPAPNGKILLYDTSQFIQ